MRLLPLACVLACTAPDPEPAAAVSPEVREHRQVVPSDELPSEASPQPANNNLDITWHDGRLFLAFRTAPNHFASADTRMVVVSSTDETTWRYEGSFSLDTDVREPQLVSWNGELHLYFAVLGTNSLDFEPQGAVYTRWIAPGEWTELIWMDDPTFIPWRIKEIAGTLHMVGYSGGENVYEPDGEPILIQWFTSDDAVTWVPAVGGDPVVLTGGGSETDFVFLDDGDLVAVVRNEAGDELGFGSKICRAPADALNEWDCASDPRKYDSPLLFRRGKHVWLVGRRNVTESGVYDLGMTDLEQADQYLTYQLDYWVQPKRCALWRVDPDALSVTWVLDLPSKGDTCFPEAVDLDGDVLLYNYSSDPEGPDYTWLEGQTHPTQIYRQLLILP